jgi:[ribosomal protein S5]-alanine N-acetyltransferase
MEESMKVEVAGTPRHANLMTKRLLLTIPLVSDAPRMAKYVEDNKEHLAPWEPSRSEEYYTKNYWTRELTGWLQEFQEGGSLRLILIERKDPLGPIIGQCNFTNIVRGPFEACYLGYSVDYRSEGSGLMFEALSEAIKYTFEHLRLHRIMANYMPTNQRSGSLLKRLNFTVEGYARDYLLLAGAWQDHILTALLNPFQKE